MCKGDRKYEIFTHAEEIVSETDQDIIEEETVCSEKKFSTDSKT